VKLPPKHALRGAASCPPVVKGFLEAAFDGRQVLTLPGDMLRELALVPVESVVALKEVEFVRREEVRVARAVTGESLREALEVLAAVGGPTPPRLLGLVGRCATRRRFGLGVEVVRFAFLFRDRQLLEHVLGDQREGRLRQRLYRGGVVGDFPKNRRVEARAIGFGDEHVAFFEQVFDRRRTNSATAATSPFVNF